MNRTYNDIFKWLLGENGKFEPRQDGEGAFWWRTELQERIKAIKRRRNMKDRARKALA